MGFAVLTNFLIHLKITPEEYSAEQ